MGITARRFIYHQMLEFGLKAAILDESIALTPINFVYLPILKAVHFILF